MSIPQPRRSGIEGEFAPLCNEAARLVAACVPGGKLGDGPFGLGGRAHVQRDSEQHRLTLIAFEPPQQQGLGWSFTADLEQLRSLAMGLLVYCEAVDAEDESHG